MSSKQTFDASALRRNLSPGIWLVEPKNEYTHNLLASRLGEEMRYDKVVVISGDPAVEVMWEVAESLLDYLHRCGGDDVDFVTYRVSSAGYPIRRDYPSSSLKL